MDIWEQVFDEIIYVNIDNADMDPTTIYTPIDKQIVFSLAAIQRAKLMAIIIFIILKIVLQRIAKHGCRPLMKPKVQPSATWV